MAVSSQTLFHFTKTTDAIKSILEGNFKPSYCLEKIPFAEFSVGVPMVCFCDIPLTQTKNHISEYGDYAIGLKKHWGIKNKLNPVFYINPESKAAERLDTLTKYLMSNNYKALGQRNPTLENRNHAYELKTLFEVISYTKPIKGSNWDKEKRAFKAKKRNLYNEREWRFVPHKENEITSENVVPLSIVFEDTFLNPDELKRANERIGNQLLIFEPKDVDYIIVKKKSEIVMMYDLVHDIKRRYGFDEKSIKELLTKIIHIKRIHEDF